jgi:hypothetical protein
MMLLSGRKTEEEAKSSREVAFEQTPDDVDGETRSELKLFLATLRFPFHFACSIASGQTLIAQPEESRRSSHMARDH